MIKTVSRRAVKAKDLRGLELFAGLNDSDLAEIARLCRWKMIQKNVIVCLPGSSTDDVYFLTGKNDAVQLELPVEGFHNVTTHVLKKGEVFGWSNFAPPQLRTTLARCTEDTEVITLKGTEFDQLLNKNRHMGYIIMKNLSVILLSRLTYAYISLRHCMRQIVKTNG